MYIYIILVIMEESFRGRGGVDSMMFDLLSRHHPKPLILNLGIEGGYRSDLGSREELHEKVGIRPEFALKAIENFSRSVFFKDIKLKYSTF